MLVLFILGEFLCHSIPFVVPPTTSEWWRGDEKRIGEMVIGADGRGSTRKGFRSWDLAAMTVIMEVDIDNMTMNKYLMYKAHHRDLNYFCEMNINTITMNEYMDLKYEDVLAGSCISKKRSDFFRVAHVRYAELHFYPLYHVRDEFLEYTKSDEEIHDDKYYRLHPLHPCFQAPQPCTKLDSISHNCSEEVDIDNMTFNEFELYESVMSEKKSEVQDPNHGLHPSFANNHRELKTSKEWSKKKFRMGVIMKKLGILTKRMGKIRFSCGDVKMGENHNVDHLKTKKELQWCLAKDFFLVFMELKDYWQRNIPSSISNEVKREFTIPQRFYAWVLFACLSLQVSTTRKDDRSSENSSRCQIKLKNFWDTSLVVNLRTWIVAQMFLVRTWIWLDEAFLEHVTRHATY
ncbi:hypothetical protein Tco_0488874 [Tanacetum coccineum]